MEPRPYGCSCRAVLITLGIFVLILLCGGVSLLAADAACWNGMTQKIPMYPNARITFERHNFLRDFGMGTTVMILDSDDSEEKVRDWYGRTVGAAARAAVANNDRLYYLPVGKYSITAAEDGTGTQIILSGDCIG